MSEDIPVITDDTLQSTQGEYMNLLYQQSGTF